MQRSRSLYFRSFYVIVNNKKKHWGGEKNVFVVCWQNLKKGVLIQYLTLTIKRGLCKQSLLMRCYSNDSDKPDHSTTRTIILEDNAHKCTFTRWIGDRARVCSRLEMRLGLTEKCRRSSEARLGSDVTGVRVPAPTNWTKTGGGRELGPELLPIFHQNGRPNIPNIGHKSGECLKLLNSLKEPSISIINQFNIYCCYDVMRLLDVCLL